MLVTVSRTATYAFIEKTKKKNMLFVLREAFFWLSQSLTSTSTSPRRLIADV